MGYFGGGGGSFSGGTITTTTTFDDDVAAQFGTAGNAAIEFDTTQVPDTWLFGLPGPPNSLVICEKADMGFNFAHGIQSDPAVFIHSRNQSTTEWISFSHNGTNGIINVGTGRLVPPSLLIGSGTTNIIGDDAYFLWSSSAAQHIFRYSTAQTPDTLLFALGTVSRTLLICERGDEDFDFAVAQQTNPTVVITSANQSTQERIGLRHNQTQGQIIDLANTAANTRPIGLHGGGNVASAATITPTGNSCHVTGTTNITNMTVLAAGTMVTLIFDDVLTFTDGNNLKLAGNFVTTADDTITLMSDGSNWYEVARSIN